MAEARAGRTLQRSGGASGAVEVLEPGLLTTVQDLGRYGYQRFGFAAAGAADLSALVIGNRLVGNAAGEAGLEITLVGPRLRFQATTAIAVTGADLGPTLNGERVDTGRSLLVRPGDVLAFAGGGRGCRAYLCVAGGIDVPPVLGSRSTDLLGRVGGLEGRPLRAGDLLPIGSPRLSPETVVGRRAAWPFVPGEFVARVVIGPHDDLFPAEAVETLLSAAYRVSPASNRMGLRLDGPGLPRSRGEVLSEGQGLGAVQVPPDGKPIVLLAGRATVGGYPKIGVVVTPDTYALAQARPGDVVRFRRVSPEEARAIYREWYERLHGDAVVLAGGTCGPEEIAITPGATEKVADPRVAEAVLAPVAGVFYRRPWPEAAPFAEEGQHVESGQTVGLVESMKTFFEVHAPKSGVVRGILPDQSEVDAGQAVARVVPD